MKITLMSVLEKSNKAFKEEMIEIAGGKSKFVSITNAKTFNNKIIDLNLYLNITKRTIKNSTHYFALVSTIDVTEQKNLRIN